MLDVYMACGMFDMGSEHGMVEEGGSTCNGASEVCQIVEIPLCYSKRSTSLQDLYYKRFMEACLRWYGISLPF